jgi:hypothetical protein
MILAVMRLMFFEITRTDQLRIVVGCVLGFSGCFQKFSIIHALLVVATSPNAR